MIHGVDPVAHIETVTIDWDTLVVHGFKDKKWNEFFGELIGTVIVATVGHDHGDFVCDIVGVTHEIATCLGGGVGHVGHDGGIFGKESVLP